MIKFDSIERFADRTSYRYRNGKTKYHIFLNRYDGSIHFSKHTIGIGMGELTFDPKKGWVSDYVMTRAGNSLTFEEACSIILLDEL